MSAAIATAACGGGDLVGKGGGQIAEKLAALAFNPGPAATGGDVRLDGRSDQIVALAENR